MRARSRPLVPPPARPLAPIEHNVVHDQAFDAGFAEHVLTPWLIAETARQPFTRDECISVDAEGDPTRVATIVTRRAELDPAPPPGPRDLVTRHAPGEPWRHGRWVAPLPSSHVNPRKGGA